MKFIFQLFYLQGSLKIKRKNKLLIDLIFFLFLIQNSWYIFYRQPNNDVEIKKFPLHFYSKTIFHCIYINNWVTSHIV